jgi:hypothetical protein
MELTLLDTLDLIRLERIARKDDVFELEGEDWGKFRVNWNVIKRALFSSL